MHVKNFHNKNQFLIEFDSGVRFQSYDSTVAEYRPAEKMIRLWDAWDYSNTTRRHFYRFLSEICGLDVCRDDILKAKESGKLCGLDVIF